MPRVSLRFPSPPVLPLSFPALTPESLRRLFRLRPQPLQWLLLALVSMVVLHVFVPIARVAPRELFWVGVAVALVGLVLANVAAVRLRRAGTVLETDLTPTVLLTDGVYGFSRNPVYLGMLLVLGGEALMLGTVGAMLPWPAMALLLQLQFVRVEERVLQQTFGDGYAQYHRRVRRWV